MMLRKTGLTLASLIFAYNTYKLVALFFKLAESEFSFLAIIISAIAFNLMITGVFAFVGFAHPTNRLLPQAYYEIKKPDTLHLMYKVLGVKYFKTLLLYTFYRREDNKKYFNGTKAGILLFDYNTKQSEFGHLMAFVAILLVSLVLLSAGHTQVFFWIQPINVALNFYPILLQRKHRMKIGRLMKQLA